MFFGDLQESNKSEVDISDASVTSFKIILQYIYTGRMNLSDLEDEDIVELFRLSNLYTFSELQYTLAGHLSNNISVRNVCSLFDISRLYQPARFVVKSPEYLLKYIESHASDVLQSEDFLSLSAGAIQDILIRDSFFADELDIFHAVDRWIKKNQNYYNSGVINNVLCAVRYPLMSDKELNEVSIISQLVSSDTISHAKLFRNTMPPHKLPFRVQQNVNLVDGSQGVLVFKEIDGGTMVKLGHTTIINKIKIIFGDKDSGDYSYYIDVSMDENDWVHVIDYSDYISRSVQHLWIPPQIVWFLRIVGTRNTVNKTVQLLEVSYNTDSWPLVKIENGLVAPQYNVATLHMDATVIEGKTKHWRPVTLFDQYDIYSEDSFRDLVYTTHDLRSGCILVQLAQPYILSSMRLLLANDRWKEPFYGYTVETSLNKQDWVMIIDNSKEQTFDWQVLQFKSRPIVFIRITGVYISKGSTFRCIYFEAPAQVPLHLTYFCGKLRVAHYRENNEAPTTMTEASAQDLVG